MHRNLPRFLLVLGCALFFWSSVAFAAERFLGTWKLSVPKSDYSPGPAPKARTIVIESTPDGIKVSSETVDADGKTSHGEYVSKFDGAKVPWTGNPDADTSTANKIDDETWENTWMKDGKPTIKARVWVSEDGKNMSIQQRGKNAKGRTVENTEVYERQ